MGTWVGLPGGGVAMLWCRSPVGATRNGSRALQISIKGNEPSGIAMSSVLINACV
jgi:hypothetical protein